MIKEAIKKLAKLDAPIDRAVVLSVDKDACTCSVQLVASEGVLEDVSLKPVVNDNDMSMLGLVIFPALQSFVTVGQVDGDSVDVVVLAFTEIESISLDTSTALKLLITATGNLNLNAVKIAFNNGKNGGIPLLNPLVAAILKLQQQVNKLTTTFNTHVHPVVGASTSPTGTPGPALITPLIKPADLENKAIVQ